MSRKRIGNVVFFPGVTTVDSRPAPPRRPRRQLSRASTELANICALKVAAIRLKSIPAATTIESMIDAVYAALYPKEVAR